MSTAVQETTQDHPLLDNPIWQALNSRHRSFNRGTGQAARYPAGISRFAALERPDAAAFDDLATLVQPGETVAFFTAEPLDLPKGWEVLRARALDQMVCERLTGSAAPLTLPLETKDVGEMLALALATEPGPFSEGTIRMGRYFGFRSEDGRLAAMAGERLCLTGYSEISAVCTDPAFRGRGYAKALVVGLAAMALAEGNLPFLHVKTENGARGLYEALGFRLRRAIQLTVLSRKSA
ncbi:GNAT family N-acetyltransferase [Acidisoma cellulosilytica]|uniref:GNAT family N-acetyltransferase n=1 Tax=Acidisoma cellulosilyticum TaxID=2802395 RepID=A0A963Z3M7_9PROT|nr:GNAT family N-acetyltransferase [Acidisoma cellulosilyticum]MCB8881994.1 GNAT family N-acetyltransferase [Acidisoma cellulosilyticum]